MAIPTELRHRIEKADFDSIEGAWLEHQAEAADDLEFFVGVARSLIGVGEEERSRFLLQMLDDQLREQDLWQARLDLLRGAGNLLLESEEIHPAILETLRALYGETPSFEGFVQATRLHKAPHDIKKTWEKVDRFRELVVFDVGCVVVMDGKGAGRVTDVNLELDSLKVDFGGVDAADGRLPGGAQDADAAVEGPRPAAQARGARGALRTGRGRADRAAPGDPPELRQATRRRRGARSALGNRRRVELEFLVELGQEAPPGGGPRQGPPDLQLDGLDGARPRRGLGALRAGRAAGPTDPAAQGGGPGPRARRPHGRRPGRAGRRGPLGRPGTGLRDRLRPGAGRGRGRAGRRTPPRRPS